ncbi:uncharacterized protein LOC135094779 isoform X1 [Scylla paramamosain]|uniref:uncharacterized protein LOC135094779 isoform X1 n=2 Tax=Scylla paramamosain TaxID=85552 RepID=UPI003083B12B
MEKIVIYVSTERQNNFLIQELESAVHVLTENSKKKCWGPSVRLASVSVREGVSSPPAAPHDPTMTLWHDWAAPEPLRGLEHVQGDSSGDKDANEGKEKEEGEEKEVFRYNDFFLLGEALHRLLDEVGEPGAAMLSLVWCVEAYVPTPSEVPEFFGALQRFQQWHFGALHIACRDRALVEEWEEYFPLQLLDKSSEVVAGVIKNFWRGHLSLWEETTGETVRLPLCELVCAQGQPHSSLLPRQQAPLYFLPTAEVMADFDGGTMPWVYLQSGAIYCLNPAPSCDLEDQEEMTAALHLFTAQPGTVTLVRLQFSTSPPVLDNLKALTTDEWKRANAEGHFDLIPTPQFKGCHSTLNMLILSEGATKGKAWVVALKDPECIGEDVMRIINTSTHTKSSHSPREADRVLELLKETPCLTPMHMRAFSHLYLHLPHQIQERLTAAGHKTGDLEASEQQEVEAAASQEILSTILEAPAPPPVLSSHLVTVPPETAVSSTDWPEYIALERAEAEAERSSHARRTSGDLLGGLAPPPSKAILTLDAAQLVKLFSKTGQAADSIRHKINKHNTLGRFPFKFTSSLEDVKRLAWPEALYAHHHGIHYNLGDKSEKFVEHCSQVERRYIRQEVASTCTVFQDKETVYVKVNTHPQQRKDSKDLQRPTQKPQNLSKLETRSGRVGRAGSVLGRKAGVRGRGERAQPLRRSPRKRQLLIPESGLRRSPRKAVKNVTGDTLADLMKPSDLLKPAHSKASASKTAALAKKVPKPADLSNIHKQKLRVAVLESLEREGVRMKDPLFKVCFKKLFAVCHPFALDVIGQGSTSKNMEKIATAHVKQVIDFERRRALKARK